MKFYNEYIEFYKSWNEEKFDKIFEKLVTEYKMPEDVANEILSDLFHAVADEYGD